MSDRTEALILGLLAGFGFGMTVAVFLLGAIP